FKTRLVVYKFEGNALAWWKAYKQAKGGDTWLITLTWADFKKLFFLQFFPRAKQERLKREYHSIRQTNTETSTELPMLLATMRSFMRRMMRTLSDQTSGRGVVIGISRPLSRVVTGATVIITTVMDRTSEVVVTTTSVATTTTLAVTTGIPVMGVTRETEVISPTNLPILKDCKKNTTASTSGQADKKPGASGRVFAITEGHAANTSGTITGTLFIYGHAVFVLFDTGATHSVISSAFALRITTTHTLLDHVLCISTPIQDSIRITHVYRNLPLQFDEKIRAINALPLDMCEFDLILGMDWLTEHHATIDCRSYRVIFGDIHAPEFVYHGSLPGKSMQIISSMQARTLLSHGCEGFLATIHDMTSEVPS
nr:putative reverse transcriptase domain-containing protein [Tanacetum cinerariifolium]